MLVGTGTLVTRMGVWVGAGVGVLVSVGVGVMVGDQVGTGVLRGVGGGWLVPVGVNVGIGVRVGGAWANTRRKSPVDCPASSQTIPPNTTMLTRVSRVIRTVHCCDVMAASSFLSLLITQFVGRFC